MPIFTAAVSTKVPITDRIAAGEALGRGGDPRLTGDILIKLPEHDGVRLGKYLVTVQGFQAFVEAGGYEELAYWSEAGWRFRQEERWMAPGSWIGHIGHSNRPVTEISWYEFHTVLRPTRPG